MILLFKDGKEREVFIDPLMKAQIDVDCLHAFMEGLDFSDRVEALFNENICKYEDEVLDKY